MANWRKLGFTQRRPKDPGVYFVVTDHKPREPAQRLRENWDIAEVRFTAGSFGYETDQREDFAHWRLKTLDGLDMAWRRGMWLKGPISPLAVPALPPVKTLDDILKEPA